MGGEGREGEGRDGEGREGEGKRSGLPLHIISGYATAYRSLNSWLHPLCKCLCHRLPDVMLSVCLLSWTSYIAEVLAGVTQC